MIKLYTMDGTDEGQSFDINVDTVYVGRSAANHVQIKDKFVSRKHLRIVKRGDEYFIKDLKSKNGIKLDVCRCSKELTFRYYHKLAIHFHHKRRSGL